MGATEIAILTLKEGENPEDQASTAAKVHRHALETLLPQPGLQRIYWGLQVEDHTKLRWFIDWDNVEDHERFVNSEYAS